MYELIEKPSLQTINAKRAKELLELNTMECQRNLKLSHVEMLKRKMSEKLFRVGSIAIAKNGKSNSEIIVNGQHTLTACAEGGFTIQAFFERYKYHTAEDLSLLYQQFDPSSAGRRLGDLVKVEAHALGLHWPERICSLVVSGAVLITGAGSKLAADQKAGLLQQYIREGEFINEIMGGGDSLHMQRQGVAASMIRTWQKNKSGANEFWTKVRDGELIRKNDPESHLRTFLLTHRPSLGNQGTSPNRILVHHHEYMYRCITAWNAYRRGVQLNVFKYLKDYPIPAVHA